MQAPTRKTIMRSLGEFVGHIWHAAAKDPDPDTQQTVLRHEVEESEQDTPRGKVTLRRTTIEEIEIPRDARG